MGPDEENHQSRKGWSRKSSSALDPPMFSAETDLYNWRRDVASWVDLISTAAHQGSDRFYQTVYATMSRQLYSRGLRPEQRFVVGEAEAKNEIDYRQEDQIKGVQDIVNLVAVDPPIAIVTRLISSFNKVTSCERKNTEHLNRFVDRFRGVAAEHLMHAGASSGSQIGEVLAITMLDNAKLEEGTLTNTKMQLIGLAESRKEKKSATVSILGSSNQVHLDRAVVDQVISLKEKADLVSSISVGNKNLSKAQRKTQLRSFHGSLKELISSIEKTRSNFQEAVDTEKNENKSENEDVVDVAALFAAPQKYILRLDDAVSVLRSLAMSSTASESAINRQQVHTMVIKNIQKAMFALNKQNAVASNHGSSFQQQKNTSQVASGRVSKRTNLVRFLVSLRKSIFQSCLVLIISVMTVALTMKSVVRQ